MTDVELKTAPAPRRRKFPPKLLGGVESPARVMLNPVYLSPNCKWHYGAESGLISGIRTERPGPGLISYQPTLILDCWEGKDLYLCVEHEAFFKKSIGCVYEVNIGYGCSYSHSTKKISTGKIEVEDQRRERFRFKLDSKDLLRNELLRASIGVTRHSEKSMISIYGAWLELEV